MSPWESVWLLPVSSRVRGSNWFTRLSATDSTPECSSSRNPASLANPPPRVNDYAAPLVWISGLGSSSQASWWTCRRRSILISPTEHKKSKIQLHSMDLFSSTTSRFRLCDPVSALRVYHSSAKGKPAQICKPCVCMCKIVSRAPGHRHCR